MLKVVCRGLAAPDALISCSAEKTPLVIRLNNGSGNRLFDARPAARAGGVRRGLSPRFRRKFVRTKKKFSPIDLYNGMA